MEDPDNPTPKWITDRLPTAENGEVAVSARPGLGGVYWYVPQQCVHPGTPWAPVDAIPDEPFDPTTLDHNGWIRSRLPEGKDIDDEGEVLIPALDTIDPECCLWVWMKAAHIVPGQPWAPAGSVPGEYQP